LQNYRVCIRHGIKVIEMAAARMHKLEVVDDYRIAFDMLKAGHCDVAVLPRQAWFEAQRLQVTGLRAMEPPLQSWPMYHYVGKAHADIVPALSNVLTQMQKSGLFDSEDAAFQRSMDEVRRVQETK
jgi:polar amino acid transport system substrate-binding protein